MIFGDAIHLKLNMSGCDRDALADIPFIKQYLDFTPAFVGMTLIKESEPIWYKDDNPFLSGITGVSILATSHISAHTFPHKGFLYVDIFSCCTFSVQDALSMTLDYFEPKVYKHWVTDRSDYFNWDLEQESI